MTQTQHTPIPWKLSVHENIVYNDAKPDDIVICGSIRSKYDAHLIAAAPDMLAALEECLLLLEREFDEHGTENPRNYERVCLDLAQSAIKKARGEV